MASEQMEQVTVDQQVMPRTFREYLRSMGPGIIVVLTWLGAGDIVECGVSGGNYGYALMWVITLALVMRFLFVSLIAKYQLCNQHGEGVLDGLARLNPLFAPFLMVVAIIMGHFYGSYMCVGIGEACVAITGIGAESPWGVLGWATLWSVIAWGLVFRSAYAPLEIVFKFLLAVLALSFIGLAIWSGPSVGGILSGTFAFKIPEQQGDFNPLLITIGMLGAIGGSLMNLAYPYFLEQKGWNGPQYRRLQQYDFLLAVVVMIVLNLAVWTVGAELIYGTDAKIKDLDDLSGMLSSVMGKSGRLMFHLGVFAAVFTSLVGHAVGLALMASHAHLRWKSNTSVVPSDYRKHPLYQAVVLWILVSPLVWTLPDMPGFVHLTLIVNSMQVVLIPILAGGLWWITADSRYIGPQFRNRWWENLIMVVVVSLALWGAKGAIETVTDEVRELLGGKKTQAALIETDPSNESSTE